MAWQSDAKHVRMCGICSRPMSMHTITRWPHRWAAYCTPDQSLESDVNDQELLATVAEGSPL